jgi:hypothetical protein
LLNDTFFHLLRPYHIPMIPKYNPKCFKESKYKSRISLNMFFF